MNKLTKIIVTSFAGVTLLGGGLLAGANADYIDWDGTASFREAQDNLSLLGSLLSSKRESINDLRSQRDQLLEKKEKAEIELDKLEDLTTDENFETDGNHALRIRFAREHYQRRVQELEAVTAELEAAEKQVAEYEDTYRRVERALDEMEEVTDGPDTNDNFIARISGVATRYTSLEDEFNELQEDVENALDELEEATNGPDTNGNFVARIFGVKTRYERLEAKYDQAEEDMDELLIESNRLLDEYSTDSMTAPE